MAETYYEGNVARSLRSHHWSHLYQAVLTIFDENKRGEGQPGAIKASSDDWGFLDFYRKQTLGRARLKWAGATGRPLADFPWSEDAVVIAYMRFRKCNADEVEVYRQEIAQEAARNRP